MAEAIRTYGWRQPIVVDADGVIIMGHRRWLAAELLGQEEVPVHEATDLSPEQVRALRLIDNRLTDDPEYDRDLLRLELEALGPDALTGYSSNEIEKLLQVEDDREEEAQYPITARLNESYNYVVVMTRNDTDWVFLQELLGLQKQRSDTSTEVGLGRVVPFQDFMRQLEAWKS